MPELPEIETICRHLQHAIVNYCIKQVIIRNHSLRFPINLDLNDILQGSIINKIHRRAKYLLIDCYHQSSDLNGSLIIHLGMSGKLSILDAATPVTKHDHLDLVLQNNTILRYNDPRRFGAIIWTAINPLEHNLLAHLGPEPFDVGFTAKYLFTKAQKKNLTIKQFIMDNKIVVGIGNIYANEALFLSKIHPLSIAKNLSLDHMKTLIIIIRKILKQAILQGGTSLKDFFDPAGKSGTFSKSLQIYGRVNQSCYICGTIIKQIKLGQRSTFFCTTCQI